MGGAKAPLFLSPVNGGTYKNETIFNRRYGFAFCDDNDYELCISSRT